MYNLECLHKINATQFFLPPPVNEITIFTGYSFIINQTNQLTITHVQDFGFKNNILRVIVFRNKTVP